MRKMMIAALVALFAMASTVNAQNERQRMSKEDAQKMMEKRAESLAKQLKLADAQKTAFVNLYAEYQTKDMDLRTAGRDEHSANSEKKSKKDEELTDAQAEERIQKAFDRDEKQLALKREYFAKMKEAGIPASKLVRVFGQQRMGFNSFNMQNGGNRGFGGGPGMGSFGGNRGGFGGPMD